MGGAGWDEVWATGRGEGARDGISGMGRRRGGGEACVISDDLLKKSRIGWS